ncbi:YdeI/OmpD-associated family protein [Algirhabdus cladophorae]|uniref:YdeI/OmpD-associated family protein n=1 Tax=Algirhabdus cladophorae TaxID=3377108 RepID=UPI003B84B5C0
MIKTENFQKMEFTSPDALRDWLSQNHSQTASIWAITYKKHIPYKYVSTTDILDALISYGWIDGIRRKVDEDRTMQMISPRSTQNWSKSYKDRAEKLEKTGQMQDAGRQAIAASQASGQWDFFNDVDALITPADLAEALGPSKVTFEALPDAYKRNLLRHIKLAKTQATRDKRITQIVTATKAGERIPQM